MVQLIVHIVDRMHVVSIVYSLILEPYFVRIFRLKYTFHAARPTVVIIFLSQSLFSLKLEYVPNLLRFPNLATLEKEFNIILLDIFQVYS